MDAAQYIARLDSFVKVIQPGLFAFAISLFILEIGFLSFKKIKRDRKGGVVSLTSGLFVFGLEALADFVLYLAIAYWFYEHRIFELGFKWYAWIFCFVLFDFLFYWTHRMQHEVRLFWCFHSVHHTTTEMRLTSAVRGSMFEFIFNPIFFVWMCILGIHPLMFIAVRTLSRIWGILTHLHESIVGKMPLMNKIFITPDVHRAHHGKNYQYLDMNYSEILSLWDRMFGTYTEFDEQPVYGILKPVDDNNFAEIQFTPWIDLYHDVREARGLSNKLKFLFMPPGWYPDGRDTRAKTLRRRLQQA